MGGFSAANRWKLCPTGGVRHGFWRQHSDAAHAGNCAETAARAPSSNFRDSRKQTFNKIFGGAVLSKQVQLDRPAPGRRLEAASTEGARQEGHQGCRRGPKSPSRSLEVRARARARFRAGDQKNTNFYEMSRMVLRLQRERHLAPTSALWNRKMLSSQCLRGLTRDRPMGRRSRHQP